MKTLKRILFALSGMLIFAIAVRVMFWRSMEAVRIGIATMFIGETSVIVILGCLCFFLGSGWILWAQKLKESKTFADDLCAENEEFKNLIMNKNQNE